MNFYQVRKEKLGDRITALQQLVSPFGKVGIWIFPSPLFFPRKKKKTFSFVIDISLEAFLG